MNPPAPVDLLAAALKDLKAEKKHSAMLAQKLEAQGREVLRLKASMDRESNSRLMAEVALDDSQDRLRLAVEAAKLALWEWDIDRNEVYLSERWGEMMGGDALPSSWTIEKLAALIHPDDVAGVRQAVRDALSGRVERYAVEHRVLGASGWIWLESYGLVVGRDMLDRATRVIGTHADISARKEAQQEMARSQKLAELASRAKSEFLANISHEIRTPLNGILGLSKLLAETSLSAEQGEYLKLVGSSANALLALVNDVLDFSKIEAGKMALESIPFSLAGLVEDVAAPYVLAARDKNLSLLVRYEGRVPERVVGDPGRLRQVLSNLLSNAIKFTERGEVELAVLARGVTNGRVSLRFEVVDTGIGVAADKQDKIFEAFQQEDASTTRKFGGTGLGLAISARLALLMGGKLGLLSLQGKGSAFSLELSLEVGADDTLPRGGALASPEVRFDGLKVLLAEDHAVNELLMRRILSKLGCEIVVARTGREAVDIWGKGGTDLILMDVQMPELSGLDATRQIRQSEGAANLPRTPVVALTAHAMAGDRERCLEAGMDAYVSKPVELAALVQAMALARTRRHSGHVATPGQGTDLAERRAGRMDGAKLLQRLGGDLEALREVLLAMQTDLSARVEKLGKALEHRDAALATSQAHALRGALSSLTADRAAMLVKGLETAARQGEWTLFQRALRVLVSEARQLDQEISALLQKA